MYISDRLAGHRGPRYFSCLRLSDRGYPTLYYSLQVNYTQNYCISYLEEAKSKRSGGVCPVLQTDQSVLDVKI